MKAERDKVKEEGAAEVKEDEQEEEGTKERERAPKAMGVEGKTGTKKKKENQEERTRRPPLGIE